MQSEVENPASLSAHNAGGLLRECRICGRPFVDVVALHNHECNCIAQKQAELDREWKESTYQPQTSKRSYPAESGRGAPRAGRPSES